LTITRELGNNYLFFNWEALEMQAVIRTGGKQYRVKPGDVIKIEKIPGSSGDAVEFGEVLMVSDNEGAVKVGSPLLTSAIVKGKILNEEKGKKLIIFKFKRRKGYRRKNGHRQRYTRVEITGIEG
jgi:large subunit ribosomal protein L21